MMRSTGYVGSKVVYSSVLQCGQEYGSSRKDGGELSVQARGRPRWQTLPFHTCCTGAIKHSFLWP